MTMLTHADMRACKYCNRGAREFADRHGINWQSFLQQGVDTKELAHIDDAMLARVIEYAERRERGEI